MMAALMSCPRIGFMDHVFSVIDGLIPLGCIIKRNHGAFWGQGLTNLIEQSIGEGCEYVVVVDYDTVFQQADARYLVETMAARPDMDALCAVQVKRETTIPICATLTEDGEVATSAPVSVFGGEFTRLGSAHFGLTVMRCAAFADVELPWFIGKPDAHGRWHEGRMDEDMHFWDKWLRAGRTLYQANRCRIGHIQMMASWPTPEMGAVHQYLHDYAKNGKPEGI